MAKLNESKSFYFLKINKSCFIKYGHIFDCSVVRQITLILLHYVGIYIKYSNPFYRHNVGSIDLRHLTKSSYFW